MVFEWKQLAFSKMCRNRLDTNHLLVSLSLSLSISVSSTYSLFVCLSMYHACYLNHIEAIYPTLIHNLPLPLSPCHVKIFPYQ